MSIKGACRSLNGAFRLGTRFRGKDTRKWEFQSNMFRPFSDWWLNSVGPILLMNSALSLNLLLYCESLSSGIATPHMKREPWAFRC